VPTLLTQDLPRTNVATAIGTLSVRFPRRIRGFESRFGLSPIRWRNPRSTAIVGSPMRSTRSCHELRSSFAGDIVVKRWSVV